MIGPKKSRPPTAPQTSKTRFRISTALQYQVMLYNAKHDPQTAAPRQVHPAGADLSHQPLLASDQVLAVPAARSRDAGRVPAIGRRGDDRRRTRRSAVDRPHAGP